MKTKGERGKGQKKMQAVLNFKQGSTRFKVKMPFNKSLDSHDSDKMLAGPSTKKCRTTKNSNKDEEIELEELSKKSKKKEKQSKMHSEKKRLHSVKTRDLTEKKKRDSSKKKRDSSEKRMQSSEKKEKKRKERN